MGEVDRYPNGTFCWIDLGTPDVEEAKAFYSALLGWETADLPTGEEGTYTMCRLDGRDVAAIHGHAPEEGVAWTSYISVDDVDGTTARVSEVGGAVLMEPFDIPAVCRMSVIRDAAGAVVSLYQPAGHIGAGLVNEIGTWTWNELVSSDLDAAKTFYEDLLGWRTEDIPAPTPRASFALGELLVGGVHAPSPGEGDEPRWTVAFRVADADEASGRAAELGGSVLLPPMDIPIGRFTIVADPAGAEVTLTAFEGPFRSVDLMDDEEPGG